MPESNLDAQDGGIPALARSVLRRERRTLLAADMVNSVGVIADNEASGVKVVKEFFAEAQALSNASGGRVVSWLGDGLIVEFMEPASAIRVARQLQKASQTSRRWHARVAIHAANLLVNEDESFGQGHSFVRSLNQVASPGDIVVTEPVYASVVEGLDGEWLDMGERLVGDFAEPTRVWRQLLDSPSLQWEHAIEDEPSWNQPGMALAVIPFESTVPKPSGVPITLMLTEHTIARLSLHRSLHVIAADSTLRLAGRQLGSVQASQTLHADKVLQGHFWSEGGFWRARAMLSDAQSGSVIKVIDASARSDAPMAAIESLSESIASDCLNELTQTALLRALNLPLPTLESASLLLAASRLLHCGPREMEQSRKMLEELTSRHRRSPLAWAWLARWHVLGHAQGMGNNPEHQLRMAIEMSQRALDIEPKFPMAMAIQGHAHSHWGKDLSLAKSLLQEAIRLDPNQPLTWLYEGHRRHFWQDEPSAGVTACFQAMRLSPIDPQAYYFQNHLGSAYFANGDYEKACKWLGASWQRNATHLSTLRAYVVSLHLANRTEDARHHFDILRKLQPDLTLERYQATGHESGPKQLAAEVFKELGLPAGVT